MKDTAHPDLEADLERSREEILQLAERVKRLVAKRNEREALVQSLRRIAAMPGRLPRVESPIRTLHLCSLCATEHASAAVDHVRGCSPGAACDQCGQPAIMWIQFRVSAPPPPD